MEINLSDKYFAENIQYVLERNTGFKYKEEQIEQIAYRLYLCKESCIEKRACEHCGCVVHDVIGEPISCNMSQKFGNFINKDSWELFKANKNISFKK